MEPITYPLGAAEGATAEADAIEGLLHETVVFTYETKIWDTDEDSFSAAGRQYFARDHGFKPGD